MKRVKVMIGPRPGLQIGFLALLLAMVAGFAYVVVDSQRTSADSRTTARRGAESRFHSDAAISAQLTASIFTASAAGTEAAAAKAYGGATVDQSALTAAAKQSRGYVLILDRKGKLLGASSGTPALVRARSTAAGEPPVHIRQALAGHSWLSDVLPDGAGAQTLEWAIPFTSASGRRVAVQSFAPDLISKFVSGYLAATRSDASGRAYVLDSRNQILGVSGEKATPGALPGSPNLLRALAAGHSGSFRDGDTTRYFTSAPVNGSTWRVVLTEPANRLYPTVAGSTSWILFGALAAFAVAGLASLLFLRRVTALNTTLEARVAERTAAAEHRAQELARSNAELEQFSSVASHDLQEPLRKILMFGDRLRSSVGDDLAEEPAADLGRMQDAARRMQRLINDLLDLARVASRGREFEAVDLGKVAGEVVSDLEARVVELQAQVDVGELPVVEADKTQMHQLLQNLVANALKFHREGEAPVIRIRGEVVAGQSPRFNGEAGVGERAVITIEDNGIGFDERHAERIFTAFERLHGRSAYDGTGIGLSIARKIVWRHGGHIAVKSVPEQGSTFTVTLPLSHRNGHG